jgi:hypothetical protein
VGDHWISPPSTPDVILLSDDLKAETLPIKTLITWNPDVLLLPLDEKDLPLQGEHELLTLLKDHPVLHTLNYSWVRVSTDGENLWVKGD